MPPVKATSTARRRPAPKSAPPPESASASDPPAAEPAAATRKSIVEAAESGTHRELLVSLRARVAKAVEDPTCPPRDLAALSRRLQEIAKEIESIDAREADEEKESGAGAAEDGAFDPAAI